MSVSTVIQRTIVITSLIITVGIFVHDTKLDYATKTALALPAMLITFDLDKVLRHGADHTHVERVSFAHAVRGMPKVKPQDEYKRFLLTQKVNKGTHSFDGYYLPEFDRA